MIRWVIRNEDYEDMGRVILSVEILLLSRYFTTKVFEAIDFLGTLVCSVEG